MKISRLEIEAAKSAKGGWTKNTLAKWGVPWPPPKGWRKALTEGKPIPRGKKSRPNFKAQREHKFKALSGKMDAAFKGTIG